VLLVVTGLYLTSARDEAAPSASAVAVRRLPATLGSLDRAWSLTGAEALREVRSLHLGDFRMASAEVAGYGDGATIWIAVPARDGAAGRYVARMAGAIAGGESPFAAPTELASAPGVWRTEGSGQQHAFFAADGAVWWLAADAADADRALQALLGEVRP
jgi:hypothetical protein